jgi:hypothetical protein
MSGGGDSYLWIGGTIGSWDDPTNWDDLNTGTVAAAVPDASSNVTIGPDVDVSGMGSAASLTFLGSATISGNLDLGTLIAAGDLAIGAQGTLDAGTGTIAGNTTVDGKLMGGNLDLGHFVQNETVATFISDGPGNTNPVYLYTYGYTPASSVTGPGTIEALTGGTIDLLANAPGSSTTFQLDGSAVMEVNFGNPGDDIASSDSIVMVGSANRIDYALAYYYGGYIGEDPTIAAPIFGFNASDVLNLVTGTIDTLSYADGTLTVGDDYYNADNAPLFYGTANRVDTRSFNVPDLAAGTSLGAVGNSIEVIQDATTVSCFAAGTCIMTPDGPVAIERLKSGDIVTTASGQLKPITWIGRRAVDCRRHPAPHTVWPIRVRMGAFAAQVPVRDLYLSPDHAVFVDNVLIPIKYLVNGDTILQVRYSSIDYFHIELSGHDIVMAEGLTVETYLDSGQSESFANRGVVMRLFPDFGASDAGAIWQTRAYAPIVVTGAQLDVVRERLRQQAERPCSSEAGALVSVL